MASVLGKRKAPSANISKKPATATATKKSSSSASKAAAATTKKRKTSSAVKPQASRIPEAEAQEADEATMDAQEIFRRHFEAAFAPLPGTAGAKRKAKKGRAATEAEESEEEEDDEEEEDLDEDVGVDDEDGWGGVSDGMSTKLLNRKGESRALIFSQKMTRETMWLRWWTTARPKPSRRRACRNASSKPSWYATLPTSILSIPS